MLNQIIINRVPHRNNVTKSLTFSIIGSTKYVKLVDIFDFLENRTNIAKRYFIIINNKKYYYATDESSEYKSIKITDPFHTIDISINTNADAQMFEKQKREFENEPSAIKFKRLFNYAQNTFIRYNPIIIDYYRYLLNDIYYKPLLTIQELDSMHQHCSELLTYKNSNKK